MKRGHWIIGLAALIVLLGAAAFIGGQLLNSQAVSGASPFQAVAGQPGGANVPGMQTAFEMEVEPAQGIPQTEPDVVGLLARRGDKSLFLTTGNIVITVGVNPDGTLSADGSADGPEVEVVIPHTAQVYIDTTALTHAGVPQTDGARQQTVEPGNVKEIGKNSMISVWGERRGDRIIAHTVLYMADALSSIPNPY